LARVVTDCGESPDRKFDLEKSPSIDDQKNRSDAPIADLNRVLRVSKRQRTGNANSG
jgi:hypothetical protein